MPTLDNYDTQEDGRPTPSHIWEQKFFDDGKRQPSNEELHARIGQLRQAQDKAYADGQKPMKTWEREIEWRKRQLVLRLREESNGDTESAE